MSNSCNKKPSIKLSNKQTDINIPSSITQMVIQQNDKSHMQSDSHLTCKVAI